MTKRLPPEVRRDQILTAAVTLAKTDGINNISRDNIAIEAGCSNGQISRMFNTMTQLKRAIMRHCVSELKKNINNKPLLLIIAHGVAAGNSTALNAPIEIKKAAVGAML